MDRIFYMEVGRSAMTGEGDYWMKAEDSNIASNMHSTIMNAMTKSKEREGDDLLPQGRKRSSSANDASKPISVISRRGTCSKLHGFSPLGTFNTLLILNILIIYYYHITDGKFFILHLMCLVIFFICLCFYYFIYLFLSFINVLIKHCTFMLSLQKKNNNSFVENILICDIC